MGSVTTYSQSVYDAVQSLARQLNIPDEEIIGHFDGIPIVKTNYLDSRIKIKKKTPNRLEILNKKLSQ